MRWSDCPPVSVVRDSTVYRRLISASEAARDLTLARREPVVGESRAIGSVASVPRKSQSIEKIRWALSNRGVVVSARPKASSAPSDRVRGVGRLP